LSATILAIRFFRAVDTTFYLLNVSFCSLLDSALTKSLYLDIAILLILCHSELPLQSTIRGKSFTFRNFKYYELTLLKSRIVSVSSIDLSSIVTCIRPAGGRSLIPIHLHVSLSCKTCKKQYRVKEKIDQNFMIYYETRRHPLSQQTVRLLVLCHLYRSPCSVQSGI
jgi:hypothetical protein